MTNTVTCTQVLISNSLVKVIRNDKFSRKPLTVRVCACVCVCVCAFIVCVYLMTLEQLCKSVFFFPFLEYARVLKKISISTSYTLVLHSPLDNSTAGSLRYKVVHGHMELFLIL